MTSNKPILYVEDDENDVFLMERAFAKAGIVQPLRTAQNGTEAIDYLAGNGAFADRNECPMPCLVLLDLNMPGKSGLEVLKWIRGQPATGTLPVVVFTSSNQESDVHRAYVLGANGYLVKPGRPEALLTMVKSIQDYWLTQNRVANSVDSSGQA